MSLFRIITASSVALLVGCGTYPAPPNPSELPTTNTEAHRTHSTTEREFRERESVAPVVVTPLRKSPEIKGIPLEVPPLVVGKSLPAPAIQDEPGSRRPSTLKDFDINGDGRVSVQEMLQVNYERLMAHDQSGDGFLSEAEFLKAMSDRRNRNDGTSNIFRQLDVQGNGLLSKRELLNYLTPAIAALDPQRTGYVRSLNLVPEFPEPEDIPPTSTIASGTPRFQPPGTQAPQRTSAASRSRYRKVAPPAKPVTLKQAPSKVRVKSKSKAKGSVKTKVPTRATSKSSNKSSSKASTTAKR